MPNSSGFSTRFNAIVAYRATLAVRGDELAEVDVGEDVAGDDQERLVELRRRVADRSRRAERLVLARVPHAQTEVGTVAEVVADLVGEVRDGDHDVVEAVPPEQRTTCSSIGLLTIGIIGLGWLLVSGRSRVPSPPARMTVFTPGPPPNGPRATRHEREAGR